MGKSFREIIEEYYAERKRREEIESRKENTAALERLARALEKTQSPEGVYSVDGKRCFYEALSPYIPEDSLDLLFGQLQEIECRNLKRVWYNKYCQNKMPMTDFFELCTNVVPHRKSERGWTYGNFQKS